MTHTTTSPPVGPLVRLRRRLKAAAYTGPGRDRWQHPRRVLDALELREGMRIADIGAGAGYFTFRLAREVGPQGHVYAVDTDADMRSLVAERVAADGLPNVTPVPVAEEEPRLPEPVDLALIVDAFHHLPEPPSYVRSLTRQFVPDGRLAVIEPYPRWWLFGHGSEPSTIRAALEGAGLTVEAEHAFLPRQAFVVARRTG